MDNVVEESDLRKQLALSSINTNRCLLTVIILNEMEFYRP